MAETPSPHARLRWLTDYGMLLVLLLLCALFSVLTWSEQYPEGRAAAAQVAGQIPRTAHRVLIAARAGGEDAAFAAELAIRLTATGTAVETALGEPREARAALERLAAAKSPPDAIACTRSTAGWLVFSDLRTDFPTLGSPPLLRPQPSRWPTFLTRNNLLNIANQIAVIAIIAIGMTVVIITAGIDLSVGSLIALSAVCTTLLIRDRAGGVGAGPGGMVLAALGGVALCGMTGLFSGVMITVFAIPPFIATLAIMLVASGAAYTLARGQSVIGMPPAFDWLGLGKSFLGLPNAVVLMVLLYAAAHVLMSRMRLGRYFYAVGGNPEAARLSGVPVRGVILMAYALSGLLAGLGGVITASQFISGSPTYGNMYELYIIAAVVVGGTSLSGGEGKMFGTLIGAFIIAVIQNGMNLTNVESYTQKIVLGAVILGAVLLDRLKRQGWSRRPSPLTPPAPGEIKRLPPLLRRAWYGLNQAFRQRSAHLGITPDQFSILRWLTEGDPAGLTQRQITRLMASDPNTINSTLARMEKAGLLVREPHERDRRAHRVRLLPLGESTFASARRIALELQTQVLRALPEARREAFLAELEAIANACAEALEGPG